MIAPTRCVTMENVMPTKATVLAAIARSELGVDTLETRNRDRLDFHDVAVWSIREALSVAYDAGKAAKPKPTKKAARR